LWWLANSRGFARFERHHLAAFDLTIVTSERERDILGAHLPADSIAVVPNCADLSVPALDEPHNPAPVTIFVANMQYRANADAAQWLVHEIFPKTRLAYSAARLLLIGRHDSGMNFGTTADGIIDASVVSDLTPYYRQADVVIAPLRAGGGTRLKVLEGMARGRVVVSAFIGAKGLGAVDGRHLLIADTSEGLAAAVLAIFRDPVRRASIRRDALALVQSRFNWDNAARTLLDRYTDLYHSRRTGRG
jgi:glycosyltransferase involved in cell wall biosynthesis